MLFGTLNLSVPQSHSHDNCVLGRVNIGWTIGEEVLFDHSTTRSETCFSENEACLLGVNKSKFAILQKEMLSSGNSKDYYVFESILKGNYLIKQNWKTDLENGINPEGKVNLERIEGLTLNQQQPVE